MMPDTIVAPLSNRLPVTDVHSPYRSRLFVATSVNPLIAAAAALLAIGPQLRATLTYQDTHMLQQQLINEVKAFEANAQQQGYRSEMILVARYILCAFVDEAIACTPWGGSGGSWELGQLQLTFQKEAFGAERFFAILERSSEDPAVHIDLLELMYLCLSLGFEGKYQLVEDGRVQLDKIMEQLYQVIRWQRGELKRQLLIEVPDTSGSVVKTIRKFLPMWLIVALAGTLLFTFYSVGHYFITKNTTVLYRTH